VWAEALKAERSSVFLAINASYPRQKGNYGVIFANNCQKERFIYPERVNLC